jgi:ABC-type nitrate/sulfonate/bicarbonate transport system permease component
MLEPGAVGRRRYRSGLGMSAIALFVACGSAKAQSLPPLVDSSSIRIWAPSLDLKSEEATFLEWQTSSLRAIHAESGDTLELTFPSITRLDLLQGKNVGLGVLGGAALGGSIGGLVGFLVGRNEVSGCTGFLCELDAFQYMAVGFGVGAIPGMAIGAAVPPDRWVRQPLPPEMGFPRPGPNYSMILTVSALLVTIAIAAS